MKKLTPIMISKDMDDDRFLAIRICFLGMIAIFTVLTICLYVDVYYTPITIDGFFGLLPFISVIVIFVVGIIDLITFHNWANKRSMTNE